MSSMEYHDEGKSMAAVLESSDPASYKLKYDMKAVLLKDTIVSMQIAMIDPGYPPWIVPDVVDDSVRRSIKATKRISESGFRTSGIGEKFYFEVADPLDSRDFVFTSRNFPFIYVRNFMHFKFMLNSRHIFGLGERINKFELSDGLYSLFNLDQTAEETGIAPGNNMWGSHAFYVFHFHDPRYFGGVFFLNSNPMDIKIRHVGMQTQVDHIFVGGIIDAFFFQKNTIDNILANYHYIIGKPAPMPYWAFGYHQCRWGYRGIEHLRQVEMSFERDALPLDGLWVDKDYMKDERDFTIDETAHCTT
jgi:hypothetical protein